MKFNLKCRAIAPGVLDKDLFRFQTLQHMMKMTRTWDSTMSMIPKGGDTIWGGIDWSPEEGYFPGKKKQRNNDTRDETGSLVSQAKHVNYGRIISFGKDVAEAQPSEFERIEFRVGFFLFPLFFTETWTRGLVGCGTFDSYFF